MSRDEKRRIQKEWIGLASVKLKENRRRNCKIEEKIIIIKAAINTVAI